MSTGRSLPSLPSDPLAAVIHLRIEQLRRDAENDRLFREARAARRAVHHRRAASAWPAAVAVALRSSLSGRPVPQPGGDRVRAHHGSAACCA